MLEHVARELDGANPILALPTNRLAEVARALESLSKLDTELEASRAVVDLCRLLRFEAYALSLTADRVSHLADPAQLAYAAGLHNRGALRERSEEAAGAKRTPHFRLCWTTAQLRRSLRHRLRGHEDVVLGCAISADGATGLSASVAERLGPSRKGTRWHQVLLLLATYRLLAPGSEWRLHRQWFEGSAMADLLGEDVGLAEIHKLYRCHDRLLEHKQALFDHLVGRWRDLFNVSFDVLLYDLTSTYFESDPPFPEGDKRRHGYSRDHRGDCVQVIIALVVTPEGLPLAYEVLPGNTADNTTLKDFLARIVAQYGKARRIWLMDRGVPTEAVLAEMRAADPPVQYLVGTPKGRLTRLEKGLVDKPWHDARPGVQVKLLPQDGELYVFAQSTDRVAKERAIRRRQLKWLWGRLKQLAGMKLSREELLMRLGAARKQARTAWRLIAIEVAADSAALSYRLDRAKLRRARRREGRYLLRTNLTDTLIVWDLATGEERTAYAAMRAGSRAAPSAPTAARAFRFLTTKP